MTTAFYRGVSNRTYHLHHSKGRSLKKSLTIVAIVAIICKPAFNLRLLQISQLKKKVFLFYEKI